MDDFERKVEEATRRGRREVWGEMLLVLLVSLVIVAVAWYFGGY
jgi:ferric-dicitrate binding protein FerR (iron transport regulator)